MIWTDSGGVDVCCGDDKIKSLILRDRQTRSIISRLHEETLHSALLKQTKNEYTKFQDIGFSPWKIQWHSLVFRRKKPHLIELGIRDLLLKKVYTAMSPQTRDVWTNITKDFFSLGFPLYVHISTWNLTSSS